MHCLSLIIVHPNAVVFSSHQYKELTKLKNNINNCIIDMMKIHYLYGKATVHMAISNDVEILESDHFEILVNEDFGENQCVS